jgi:hypothetical protein
VRWLTIADVREQKMKVANAKTLPFAPQQAQNSQD